MARNVTSAFITASRAGTVLPFLLAEVWDSEGALRVWSGYGDLSWDGETWIGTGDMGQVSAIQETADLYAGGATFSLAGTPASLVSMALGTMRQGLPTKLYLGFFDTSTLAIVADPALLFSGLTDVPEIEDSGEQSRISISAESELIRLETPVYRRYTHEDQQLDYPGDKGFEYVPTLQDREITFGG